MRILIATAVYYPQINGVAVFSHNLALGLVKRGHEVMVICPSHSGKSYTRMIDGVKTVFLRSVDAKIYPDQIHAVPEKKKKLGIKWPRLVYKHGFHVSVFPYRGVKKAMKKFSPDVVHVQVSDPIGLSVVSYARRHRIPVVTTEHNQPEVLTEPLRIPGVVRKPVNALLYSYFRNRQSKSDYVTMPTRQAIENLLSRGELGVPMEAVSNGVDISKFKPGKAKQGIYEKYGISPTEPVVLYVGRVDPEKQVGLVLEAFIKARLKVPKLQLVVVGDGVDRLRLTNEAKRLGVESSVKFLGRIVSDDLYELYKTGSVFVTGSEVETQGIVLIEAASTGLPLIAVDKGAVSEVCCDGINGFLCRPGDVDQIAKSIVKIVSNEKIQKEFGQKSLEIASGHDFEKTLDRFLEIYQNVIDKNNVK